jgi:hypothetical protein
MLHTHHVAFGRLNRRHALLSGAAALAGATFMQPTFVEASTDDHKQPQPPPRPIAATFPGTPFHVLAPGPNSLMLPFSGSVPQGLDVDPSVMTDFDGFTALAYPVGSARGSDGKTYNLEGDMRLFTGTYVPFSGGSPRSGTFGFV